MQLEFMWKMLLTYGILYRFNGFYCNERANGHSLASSVARCSRKPYNTQQKLNISKLLKPFQKVHPGVVTKSKRVHPGFEKDSSRNRKGSSWDRKGVLLCWRRGRPGLERGCPGFERGGGTPGSKSGRPGL